MRLWLECIDAVSSVTRLNWSQIWELPAMEFLTYLQYYNYKMKKEARKAEEFRKKTMSKYKRR